MLAVAASCRLEGEGTAAVASGHGDYKQAHVQCAWAHAQCTGPVQQGRGSSTSRSASWKGDHMLLASHSHAATPPTPVRLP